MSWPSTLVFKTDFPRSSLIARWSAFHIPVLENVILYFFLFKTFKSLAVTFKVKLQLLSCSTLVSRALCMICAPRPSSIVDTYTHLIQIIVWSPNSPFYFYDSYHTHSLGFPWTLFLVCTSKPTSSFCLEASLLGSPLFFMWHSELSWFPIRDGNSSVSLASSQGSSPTGMSEWIESSEKLLYKTFQEHIPFYAVIFEMSSLSLCFDIKL